MTVGGVRGTLQSNAVQRVVMVVEIVLEKDIEKDSVPHSTPHARAVMHSSTAPTSGSVAVFWKCCTIWKPVPKGNSRGLKNEIPEFH